MIELYHNDMSTCAQKVRIVLAEKGLEWEGRHMNLRAGDTVKPDYLKLNPAGVVPTLIDHGRVVIESNIIIEYLDDQYPDTPLRPNNSIDKARMRLWNKQLDDDVHAATSVVSNGIAFRYQHHEKTPGELEDYLRRIPDAARRERKRDLIANGVRSPVFAAAILRFHKLLNEMETTLSDCTWLAGERYSLSEAAFAPYMTRLEHLQLQPMIDRRPSVKAWFERIKERASYAVAVEKWFNSKYLVLMEDKGREAWPQIDGVLTAA